MPGRWSALQILLGSQLQAHDQDLADLLKAEPELAHLTSVLGIGLLTAIIVVAETTG
jgi:transposase